MTNQMTPLTQRIGFLGTGQMATALAGGFIAGQAVPPSQIIGVDVSAEATGRFQDRLPGSHVVAAPAELCEAADVIFLSVKPQQMKEALAGLSPQLTERHLIVSIAAGISLQTMATALGNERRFIRVMPNTPALVNAGASAFCRGGAATDHDADLVKRLLNTVGLAVEVPESLMDAVTGLSGSGPAYVYQFIEALSDGGVRVGLPRAVATQLAAQTVLGAAKMVLETGQHPGALKDAVTSPGGTTIAGLHALEQGGLRGTLMDAVLAATERSKEMGRS